MKHWENHSFLKVNNSLKIHLSKFSLFSLSSSSPYSSTSLSPSSCLGGWLSCDPHLPQTHHIPELLIMTLTSLSSDLLLFRAGITALVSLCSTYGFCGSNTGLHACLTNTLPAKLHPCLILLKHGSITNHY